MTLQHLGKKLTVSGAPNPNSSAGAAPGAAAQSLSIGERGEFYILAFNVVREWQSAVFTTGEEAEWGLISRILGLLQRHTATSAG